MNDDYQYQVPDVLLGDTDDEMGDTHTLLALNVARPGGGGAHDCEEDTVLEVAYACLDCEQGALSTGMDRFRTGDYSVFFKSLPCFGQAQEASCRYLFFIFWSALCYSSERVGPKCRDNEQGHPRQHVAAHLAELFAVSFEPQIPYVPFGVQSGVQKRACLTRQHIGLTTSRG